VPPDALRSKGSGRDTHQRIDGAFAGLHTRLSELSNLESDASVEIAEFFPDLTLHLDIQAPAFEDLIKGAVISLSDGHGDQSPFTSFGHGAQRTVQMALIKLLATRATRTAGQGATTVLLIDEPELYLHPQAIERLRDALDSLSQSGFQVIFSTHSPLMLGGAHVLDTAMVVKDSSGATAVRTKLATAASTIAAHSHQANVIFSIQHATHLLFSEKVIVVEGKTEMTLLPALYKVDQARSMAYDKTYLIEASSSSSVWPMMQVLRGIGFSPKSVVDLDFIFKVAPQNGLINSGNPDFQACLAWFAANAGNLGRRLSEKVSARGAALSTK
jgi:putative ATP-dependent endonuclease of OLD family